MTFIDLIWIVSKQFFLLYVFHLNLKTLRNKKVTFSDTPQTFDAELPLETPKHTTTYEELRQKNREEYMKRQSIPPRPMYPSPQDPQEAPVYRRPVDENPSQPKTNKYGDTWSS